MIAEDSNEQNSVDKYDEMFEAVLSVPDFYPSPKRDIHQKESKVPARKRFDLDREHSKMNFSSKKRKETTKDRLLEWNSFYSNQFGIWIQCTKCAKWRKSLEYEEEHEVPTDWHCSMSISGTKDCNDPENVDEADFSLVNFIPGSIVWAKLEGYPWWPGMIEDDPDTEEYYWICDDGKLYYNVTFLDEKVTRAWVATSFVRSYLKPAPRNEHLKRNLKMKYSHLIEAAKEKANTAIKMTIKERLKNFSFAHLYKGKWPEASNLDDDEDITDIAEMLIKEVEEIGSIKSFVSDSETNTLEEMDHNNDFKNMLVSENKQNINSKYKQKQLHEGKINLEPRSNKKPEIIIINEREKCLSPSQNGESSSNSMGEFIGSVDCFSKKTGINMTVKVEPNFFKKESLKKTESTVSKLNKKTSTKLTTPTKTKNDMHDLDKSERNNNQQKISVQKNKKANKRANSKEKLELTEIQVKENDRLANFNLKKKKVANEKKKKDDANKPFQNTIKNSVQHKLLNSKKKLSFQPPIKDKANNDSDKMSKENNNLEKSHINNKVSNNVNANALDFNEKKSSDLEIELDSDDAKPNESKIDVRNTQEIRQEEKSYCSLNKKKTNTNYNTENQILKSKSQLLGNETDNKLKDFVIDLTNSEISPNTEKAKEKNISKKKILQGNLRENRKEINIKCKLTEGTYKTKEVISKTNEDTQKNISNINKKEKVNSEGQMLKILEKNRKNSIENSGSEKINSSTRFLSTSERLNMENSETNSLTKNKECHNRKIKYNTEVKNSKICEIPSDTQEQKTNIKKTTNKKANKINSLTTNINDTNENNLSNIHKIADSQVLLKITNDIMPDNENMDKKTDKVPAKGNKNKEKSNKNVKLFKKQSKSKQESKIEHRVPEVKSESIQKDGISDNETHKQATEVMSDKDNMKASNNFEDEQKNSYSLSLNLHEEEQSESGDSDPFEVE